MQITNILYGKGLTRVVFSEFGSKQGKGITFARKTTFWEWLQHIECFSIYSDNGQDLTARIEGMGFEVHKVDLGDTTKLICTK